MSVNIFLLVLTSVLFSAAAQILLRTGMTSDAIQGALANSSEKLQTLLLVAANPSVLAGLLLYGLSAVLWLLVLARVPVTIAYPFVGLGFLVTLCFGWLFLGEHVTALRLLGTCLVVVGVALVGKSA